MEMITGTLPTNTFATFWRQAREQGYYPDFVDIGKAVDYPGGVTALGAKLANYLSASITWYRDWPYKSSLTGQTCEQFATAYEKATGNESNCGLGFYGAGWEIINDTLTRAGELDPEAIRTALSQTDMDTILCHVKFNAQNWSRSPVIQAQWVYEGPGHGSFPWKRVAFYGDKYFPNLPANGKLVFPIPH